MPNAAPGAVPVAEFAGAAKTCGTGSTTGAAGTREVKVGGTTCPWTGATGAGAEGPGETADGAVVSAVASVAG